MALQFDVSHMLHYVAYLTLFTSLCDGHKVRQQSSDNTLATCIYDNQVYHAGTKFRPDSCTFCHCPRTGGRPNCAVEDCKYDPSCVRYIKTSQSQCCDICVEHGCQDTDGTVYRPGDVVSVTSCTECTCPIGGGRVECARVGCPNVTCVDAVSLPGSCCPTCPNGPNCWMGKEVLPSGVEVKRNRCKTCRCPDDAVPLWLHRKGARAVCTISCS